jgi:hypothetical protein
MTKLENALEFLKRGIAVIPLGHRSKSPDIKTWEPYKSQLPTEYQVRKWLSSGWNNYGVVAGWNGIGIIDFDTPESWLMWQTWFAMINKHAEIYPRPFTVTTARGAHVYVRLYNIGANQKRVGVDVKVHGYVVGPGSIHPSGAEYKTADTEYLFPDVFDLDTFLPLDLFPMVTVVPAAEVVNLPFAPVQPCTPSQQDYDAFETASGRPLNGSQGLDLVGNVKSSVRIENLFPDARFTSLDHRWMAAKCPFHPDNNPSMWIDVMRQVCGCQVCGMKPMDSINLYSRMHNVTDSQAVGMLARELGVTA